MNRPDTDAAVAPVGADRPIRASAVPRRVGRDLPTRAALQVARGFFMGSADLVPGVSGGTIALVFGIYDELVAVIREAAAAATRLLVLDLRGGLGALAGVHWWFVTPLLAGIVLAIVTLAGPLSILLARQPVLMSALFFGLITGSVAVAAREVRRRDPVRLGLLVAVAVATFVLLGLRGGSVRDPGLVVLFGAGALAVCAMILPGISGSFILLTVGLYHHLLEAVHQRAAVELAVFTAGAAIGLGLFSSGLHWLIEHHRDTVMAALVGLMVGSLRVLWMWPSDGGGVGDVRLGPPVTADVPSVLVAGVAGAVAVVALARLGLRREAARPR
ncbi:MAG TPA: DUF368 domain-containing protein [Nitriliruptorales bacterium]|nr:DUF368 domain-containing protein [Nitriliruptorales bacterium]